MQLLRLSLTECLYFTRFNSNNNQQFCKFDDSSFTQEREKKPDAQPKIYTFYHFRDKISHKFLVCDIYTTILCQLYV